MVSESRTGGNRVMGPDDDEEERKMIESIREIVGNHSDADIYTALKEADMDADEAVQKLIHQDPFHEVKRRKDRKKEDAVVVEPANVKKPIESVTGEVKVPTQSEHNVRRGGYSRNVFPRNAAPQNAFPRKPLESVTSEVKVRTQPENNVRRGGYGRNVFPRNAAPRNAFPRNPATGSKREFRVVRDNSSNRNVDEELKHSSAQSYGSNSSKVVATENKKGSTGGLGNHHSSGTQGFADDCNAAADVRLKDAETAPLHHPTRKELSDGKQASRGVTLPSTNSVLGVYSSSTDPVHVPSPVSRSSPVGAIKREVRGGAFGGKPSEVIAKDPSAGTLSKIGTPNAYRSSSPNSKINQVSQTTPRDSVLPSGVEKNRPLLNRQRGNRGSQYARTQQVGGHTKGVSQNKEWKPKSIQKPVEHNPGVIGTPTKSKACRPADNTINLESEALKLQDKLSHVHISETQNVIIADHIRLPETDRCQLTFGSFAQEFTSLRNSEPAALQESYSSEERRESDRCSPVTSPEILADGPGVKPIDILDDHLRISESDSRVSVPSEQLLPEEEAHRSDNLDEYSEIQLLKTDNLVPFQQAYGNHGSYDFPYFSQTVDENVRGQGLPSQQEALSTHMVNSAPPSTIPMLQQQQQASMQQQQQQQQASMQQQQMYPQVHVSHFPNLMPYRQFLSPLYVPQMPMPGYSGNPAAYAHPSSGNSYVLMPGGGSHPGSNGVKYGIQQFKPVPGGPAGFGTYNSPNGYQISSPNVVGNAMGLEDPSRMKYKDGNIYVPNPQAETSEIWMQNPRDLSNLQSPPYYNVAGQTPHGAYLPSHTAHPSFNSPAAAATQSSQMQFQGLFHPPQPGPMANLHHMGPGLGGNVGVGVVPSPPSQHGHPSWAANF